MNRTSARKLLISINAGADRVRTGGQCYTIYRGGYVMADGNRVSEPVAVLYGCYDKTEIPLSAIVLTAYGNNNKVNFIEQNC